MYGSLLKGRKVSGVVLCQVHFEKKWERLWGEGHAMDNISPSKITVSLLRVSVLQIATSAKAQIVGAASCERLCWTMYLELRGATALSELGYHRSQLCGLQALLWTSTSLLR